VLLEKFLGNSKDKSIELITNTPGAYESPVRTLFKNISYIVVALGRKAYESTLCINAICLAKKVEAAR